MVLIFNTISFVPGASRALKISVLFAFTVKEQLYVKTSPRHEKLSSLVRDLAKSCAFPNSTPLQLSLLTKKIRYIKEIKALIYIGAAPGPPEWIF